MIAFSILLLAAAPSLNQASKCEELSPDAAVIACYERAAANSRDKVDKAFDRVLKSAERADVEVRSFERQSHVTIEPRAGLVSFLRRSQAAWIEYSDKQCGLEGSTSHGGSGTGSLNAECHYRMNLRRLSDLKTALELIQRSVRN